MLRSRDRAQKLKVVVAVAAALALVVWSVKRMNGQNVQTQQPGVTINVGAQLNIDFTAPQADSLDALQLKGGEVKKQGLLDFRYTEIFDDETPEPEAPANWKGRQYELQMESLLRVTAGTPPDPDKVKTEYLHCPVLVNDKYRLAYVRIQKTGSSSIKKHFTGCSMKSANPDTCLRELDSRNATANTELWRSYFVFSVVRNPYARLVSMYNYLTRGSLTRPQCARHGYSWERFCADPAGVATFCPAHPKCCFEEKGSGEPFTREAYFRHVQQQSRCLGTAGGGWAVDYLLRTEHLSEDLKAMVAHINRRRAEQGSDVPPLPDWLASDLPVFNPSQHASFQEFYKPPHTECLEATQRLFADDLQLLVQP